LFSIPPILSLLLVLGQVWYDAIKKEEMKKYREGFLPVVQVTLWCDAHKLPKRRRIVEHLAAIGRKRIIGAP